MRQSNQVSPKQLVFGGIINGIHYTRFFRRSYVFENIQFVPFINVNKEETNIVAE